MWGLCDAEIVVWLGKAMSFSSHDDQLLIRFVPYEGKCLYLQWPMKKLCDGGVMLKKEIWICSLAVDPDLKLLHTVKVFSVYLFWQNTSTSWLEFEHRELCSLSQRQLAKEYA